MARDNSGELLDEAVEKLRRAGIERPVFEAQLLLALAVGGSRLDVVRGLGRPVTTEERCRFESIVEQRKARVPLPYLRGSQEFYGLEFIVSPAVLIPRPETELIVDFALERTSHSQGVLIDVGTGSGCIAISIAVHAPELTVVACDNSPSALTIAQANSRRLAVQDRIYLAIGNALSMISNDAAEMIVTNPPYIAEADINSLQAEVQDFEPRSALVAEEGGLALHRRIAGEASRVLKPGGWLAAEVALGQATDVQSLFDQAGLQRIEVRNDLAGIPRVVAGQKPE